MVSSLAPTFVRIVTKGRQTMKTTIVIQFSNGEKAEVVLKDEAEQRLRNGDFLTIKTQHPDFGRLAAVDMQPRGTVIQATARDIRRISPKPQRH